MTVFARLIIICKDFAKTCFMASNAGIRAIKYRKKARSRCLVKDEGLVVPAAPQRA